MCQKIIQKTWFVQESLFDFEYKIIQKTWISSEEFVIWLYAFIHVVARGPWILLCAWAGEETESPHVWATCVNHTLDSFGHSCQGTENYIKKNLNLGMNIDMYVYINMFRTKITAVDTQKCEYQVHSWYHKEAIGKLIEILC